MPDKFKAVWVSHSSISDFVACPRSYYLNNVYKDPATGHKITIMSPALALGQALHEVVESLSVLPTDDRFKQPLKQKFDLAWKKVAGEKGGFESETREKDFFEQGVKMLKMVEENPGPLKNLAVKIKMDLPYYWLSEEDEIILCGKIDWLEYLPDYDQVHIIDFKTGRNKEREDSLQLPIYYLLATNCQKREVVKVSYWYLRDEKEPVEEKLPESELAQDKVMEIAKKIKLARKLGKFECPDGGCRHCIPLEQVVDGKAKFVGVNDFNQDMYVVGKTGGNEEDSVIL